MKIRMLETRKGSPNGITIIEYIKGESYDLPPDLARIFLTEHWAKREHKVVLAEERKVVEIGTKKHRKSE